jgi:hypothetical protein
MVKHCQKHNQNSSNKTSKIVKHHIFQIATRVPESESPRQIFQSGQILIKIRRNLTCFRPIQSSITCMSLSSHSLSHSHLTLISLACHSLSHSHLILIHLAPMSVSSSHSHRTLISFSCHSHLTLVLISFASHSRSHSHSHFNKVGQDVVHQP